MLRTFRGRLSYANVTASVALFVALGGTSYAVAQLPASSVGPKQLRKNAVTARKIKRNAIRSAKVKDGSLLAQDFKPEQLPAGPAGDKGEKGDTGLRGEKGEPGPITGNAPSGVTLRGVVHVDVPGATAGTHLGESISFGLTLPSRPEPHVLSPGAPRTPSCPGNSRDPQAAPGHLCIYEDFRQNGAVFTCSLACQSLPQSERWGTQLFVDVQQSGRVRWGASWAVTAP